MKDISRLIESIEADAADDLDFELECQELVYSAVDENFKKIVKELKANRLALDFAEALAVSAKGMQEGYFPELIADTLANLDTRFLKKVYSFLQNTRFANSDEEIFAKARQAAGALQEIGDKYFPGNELMNITGDDEDFVWTECFPEFWRYLLAGLIPDKKRKRM